MFNKVLYCLLVVAACSAQHHVDEVEVGPVEYNYQYGVRDDTTGDIKEHQEERHGDVTRGVYSLVEPDGSRRTVEYSSQPGIGFNAIVHREPNQHPTQHQVQVQPVVQHQVQVQPVVQHHVQVQPVVQHHQVVQPIVQHQVQLHQPVIGHHLLGHQAQVQPVLGHHLQVHQPVVQTLVHRVGVDGPHGHSQGHYRLAPSHLSFHYARHLDRQPDLQADSSRGLYRPNFSQQSDNGRNSASIPLYRPEPNRPTSDQRQSSEQTGRDNQPQYPTSSEYPSNGQYYGQRNE